MVEFRWILTVASELGTHAVSPSHCSLSPPIVTRTRFTSAFNGLIVETNFTQVTFLSFRINIGCMKNTVFVPDFIRTPIP